MSEKGRTGMVDTKSIATRVVVRGLVSLTTEERDELLSWEQAAYAAEEANGRCAELAAEIERLKGQDEVHWKTRRTLLAELERHQAEDRAAITRLSGLLARAVAALWDAPLNSEGKKWIEEVSLELSDGETVPAIQRAREGK